jgi:hypothetical protein
VAGGATAGSASEPPEPARAPSSGDPEPRRRRIPLAVLALGLVLGLAAAVGLNEALGITFVARERPVEPPVSAPDVAAPADLETVAAIVVPQDDEWVARAAAHVADALQARTGQRPEVVAAGRDPGPGRRVLVADPDPTAVAPTGNARANAAADDAADSAAADDAADSAAPGAEAFLLAADDLGLTLRAASRDGQLVGLAWLADRIASGADEADFTGEVVVPDVPRRLVDLGGLGVPRDPEHWDAADYSHDVRRFETAQLPGPPWVDADAFAAVEADFLAYLDRMRSYGNNGIVADGFLELIDFDDVGDGQAVYPADSPYRDRHAAMREHLGGLWELADDAGMHVYLMHTELALTPPLEDYLLDTFGTIDTEDPRLWAVYQAGIAELFERFPSLDGLVVRIGEAGDIYDPASGLEYTTRLAVRTDAAVHAMLDAFLEVAEAYDREIVFRSWTVGVGEVGRLHHDPEAYERVLGALDHPNLVVSTKYVQGDFYSFVPFNETLLAGDHRRMVELQNRLEFEGFMAFPNLIGPMHGAALDRFLAADVRIEGVWQWNQDGGPQQAGPQSLYPFHGDWQHIDANAYTTSRLAFDRGADPSTVAADWVRRTFGDDPEVVGRLTEVLARSREAATSGLYVSAYAEQLVQALGLDTTPMMWIFEWDIVSGDSAVLATTYLAARDELDAAIAEGDQAVAIAREMRTLAASVDPARVTDPARLEDLVAALDYQLDLFETLAAWRTTFLTYHRWLDTGEPAARDAWRAALADFEPRRAAHEARYGNDLDRPAYSFEAVDRGLVHATRTGTMAWIARALLVVLAVGLLAGARSWSRRGSRAGSVTAPGAITAALAAPGSGASAGAGRSPHGRWLAVLVVAGWLLLAFLTFSSFASPHYLALQVLVVGVFAGVVVLTAWQGRRGSRRRPHPGGPVTATTASSVAATPDAALGPSAPLLGLSGPLLALSGPLLAVTAVLITVVAVRGPGYFWLRFWTSTGFRTWFTIVSVALLVWLAHAVVATLRTVIGGRTTAAVGGLLTAVGATLVAVGAVPGVAGLERLLTGLNDELAVLPLGLSRILGITVHLGIPTALPGYLVAAGGVLVAAGLLLRWAGNRAPQRPSHLDDPAAPDGREPRAQHHASGDRDVPGGADDLALTDDRTMEIDR